MITKYIIGALLSVILGMSGGLWWLRSSNATLRTENDALTVSLLTCDARIANITATMARRRDIETLSDDDLRDRLLGWLPKAGSASGTIQ